MSPKNVKLALARRKGQPINNARQKGAKVNFLKLVVVVICNIACLTDLCLCSAQNYLLSWYRKQILLIK